MAKSTAKSTAKPTKGGSTKPVKGGHYTPPNASKEMPRSFYEQPNKKGKKRSEIPDD